MGSQTLEILRQGVWASVTGGWFYDPHQNVFCNAAHLYLWLFLLCSPFLSYLYFPATLGTWIVYCVAIAFLFSSIKITNLLLHRMYDSAQGLVETGGRKSAERNGQNDDEGIELQDLGTRGASGVTPPVGCSSRNSFIEPRSDNSNAESQASLENNPASTIDLKVDVHRKNSSESSEGCATVEVVAVHRAEVCPTYMHRPNKSPNIRDQIQSQKSLDSTLPTDHNNSEFNINLALMHARIQSLASDPFLEDCSKSANQLTPNVRRESAGGTGGSALQLGPRRHSNFGSRPPPRPVASVRRIKSTALETCCPPPSVSNLSPHPNSAEGLENQSVLPPPSQSLVRNPHLNLLPNSEQNFPEPLYNTDSVSVYPIAEQIDERPTDEGSHCMSESDSDIVPDTDTDPSLKGDQSDSDTENNGSRSPLLERVTCETFVVPKPAAEASATTARWQAPSNSSSAGELDLNMCAPCYVTYNKTKHCPEQHTDTERVSASSKDMLLCPGKELENLEWLFKSEDNNECEVVVNIQATTSQNEPTRSLGAIPKTARLSGPSRETTRARNRIRDRTREQPIAPLLTAFLSTRSDFPMLPICLPGAPDSSRSRTGLDRNHRNRHRKLKRSTRTANRHNRREVSTPELNKKLEICLSNALDQSENVHFATSFDDTTEGAIHCFVDEHGNWMSYTFDKKGQATSQPEPPVSSTVTELYRALSCPVSSSAGDNSADINTATQPIGPVRLRFTDDIENIPERRQKRSYKFKLWKRSPTVKISMDRLQLLALFDRDMGTTQAVLAIILALMVAFLGAAMLHLRFYEDVFAFVFCLVIAGSQYSLLKSVQPDAASPVHGFNKTVAYSRPIYFCLSASIALFAHYLLQELDGSKSTTFTFFGFPISLSAVLSSSRDGLATFLLFFPIMFSLGLFPQINTFLMYALEQIDMHVFGGNAACSLIAAAFSLLKSVFITLILFGPAYGGLVEPKGTQHVLFSIFCAILVALSYHLSRSASDFSCAWNLIKTHLLPSDLFAPFNPEKMDGKPTVSTMELDVTAPNEKDTGSIPMETLNSTNSVTTVHKELVDPLPAKLQATVNARFKNDLLVCPVIVLSVLGLHSSTVFSVLQPDLNTVLRITAAVVGFLGHYVLPQLRKQLPWLCISRPMLRPHEHGRYEVQSNAKVMWFEQIFVVVCFIERNILYPLVFLSSLTADSSKVVEKFGAIPGTFLVVICGMKCFRSAYSDPASQYLILIFCELFFSLDYHHASETFLVDYALVSILYRKISEFLLKMQFVVTYIAPWQITWGSAFHAFAQPFSVPHSAMLFLQAAISAILSTPLNPFLGSAIFLTSYVRPVKFWERDYNTRRMDQSNTRLSSNLERNLGADDNNLNSIFYEHLTRSLQHSLCGDLLLGRWGPVVQGDCFVLASDYLNCLVHVIELGNGLCTFQVRGLEFRGTYCQQREVEAISEGVEDNEGCCCFSPGHIPRLLSLNAMFSVRWLAWQVAAAQYVLEGYSISDISAVTTLQVFEFRKVLITYYVKSLIYYTITSIKLQSWITNRSILDALQPTLDRGFVDLDPIFNQNLDEDFDFRSSGITRLSFCSVYMDWIQFCAKKRSSTLNTNRDSPLVSLCLKLALLARRTLGAAAHHSVSSVEFFLHGLHALFKGDFRITSARDEWVFADMDLLHGVVAPAVRMSLKLHQDHFMSPEEYDDPSALYEAISGTCSNHPTGHMHSPDPPATVLPNGNAQSTDYPPSPYGGAGEPPTDNEQNGTGPALAQTGQTGSQPSQTDTMNPSQSGTVSNRSGTLGTNQDSSTTVNKCDGTCSAQCGGLVISHEADPQWRSAVLSGTPNLLALRHVMDDGADEYRVIRLSKRHLTFRVIRLNRECVRGLWAGQQQELVYLRNRNPERGSIQNAKQALRNIINSSCDQPIGYPIYVSPLTTSYAETNEQLTGLTGGAFTLQRLKQAALSAWTRIRLRCREGCSSGSGSAVELGEGVYSSPLTSAVAAPPGGGGGLSYGSQNLSGTRGGGLAACGKPSSSTLLAGLLNRSDRESLSRGDRVEPGNRDSNSLNRSDYEKEREFNERENKNSALFTRFDWDDSSRDSEPIVRITALLNRFERERETNFNWSDWDRDTRTENDRNPARDIEPVVRITALLNRIERERESLALTRFERERDRESTKKDRPDDLVTKTDKDSKEAFHSSERELTIDYWETLSGLLTRVEAGESTRGPKRTARPPLTALNTGSNDAREASSSTVIEETEQPKTAVIVDPTQVYDCLDLGRRIDVMWPEETMRAMGGRSSWRHWAPQEGMVGLVVHAWVPHHPEVKSRSNNDKVILLLQVNVPIGDAERKYYVPIAESGVKIIDESMA